MHEVRLTLKTRLRDLLEYLLEIPDTPVALLHVVLTFYPT